MNPNAITTELTVADILNRWPQVIPVFLKYKLKCVGCSMAAFEMLADALRIHGVSAERFLADVNEVVSQGDTNGAQ